LTLETSHQIINCLWASAWWYTWCF